MKTIKTPDETFRFLAWLVKQDVTLPGVLVDHLKWNHFSKQEVKAHLRNLHNACIDAENMEITA